MNNRNPYGDAIFHNSAPNRNSLRYPNDYQIGSSSRSRNQDNNSDKSNLESLFWEAAEFILNYAPTHDISFKTHQLSFLQPGRTFTGSQNLILDNNNNPADKDKWEVKVAIHSINPEQGTIVGLMEALNVPSAATTVITYWEGEIIDFVNFTMRTKKWSADSEVDLFHWKMFQPFKHFDPSEENIQSIYENYIFMRWKEKFFVNVSPTESGLTIAGFYYICIRRIDGHIEGN
ncbi:hypothetical protein CONCODRAFT_38833 [Conidiobolus coronatus NRRL 28638]|uniref:Uncharacterized protein n=1 Tax=Conidiobolus coronatus (strain ATCC 28846 / CBS 209.66 / NRRL 28638) TaxID=796925 RepID=A0A137P7M5_CONC2|nr:hypothetical protein CONCODRAFT_38833 [Conidiobolus coronatus NRRL 28638]|eukprot:KXN70992.1 hypothetical protein CONCODRAFT_38833 [Conidiobolus coronatus NRRL 28638]